MYLLIVTGMSGAGKSLALQSLEEQNFFCVDNLPSDMLRRFVDLCKEASPPVTKAAVTIDSRESLLSRSPNQVLDALDKLSTSCEILFLDARDDVLKKRYNETRRRHPLGEAGEAESGVQHERLYLQEIRNRANYVVDTSEIEPRNFPDAMAQIIPEIESKRTAVIVSSFGYKRGVPVDADFVLDMRFVENPFYIPELRPQSGRDEAVRTFVFAQPFFKEFLDKVESLLCAMLPLYEKQGKHILRIAFGCTGGRHRSVAAAEELELRCHSLQIPVRLYHRDLRHEAEQIEERFSNKE